MTDTGEDPLASARLKATQRGKEPFDMGLLASLYNVTDELGNTVADCPTRAQELERDYYLRHPDVDTIKAFAVALYKGPVEDLADEFLEGLIDTAGAANAQALVDAREKAAQTGKEPFDLARLEQLYDITGELGTPIRDRRARAQELERDYYLRHPEVSSIEAFAEAKTQSDLYR